MTTLNAGSGETQVLAPGQILTATAGVASAGMVRRFITGTRNSAQNRALGAGGVVTVGPYLEAVEVGIECTVGTVTWAAGTPQSQSQAAESMPDIVAPPVAGAVQALVSSAGSLASPMLIAKTNATFSRVSANTAADNTFGTLYSFLLPGGSMGPNGTLRWEAELGFTDPATNAGTTVGFQLRIGAVGICPEVGGSFAGGQLFANQSLEWHNTAVAAQKYRGSYAKQGGSSAGFLTTTIDTAVDQTVDFAARWSGATPSETLSLLSLRVWVEYGA